MCTTPIVGGRSRGEAGENVYYYFRACNFLLKYIPLRSQITLVSLNEPKQFVGDLWEGLDTLVHIPLRRV